jgi:hypothetical protein
VQGSGIGVMISRTIFNGSTDQPINDQGELQPLNDQPSNRSMTNGIPYLYLFLGH